MCFVALCQQCEDIGIGKELGTSISTKDEDDSESDKIKYARFKHLGNHLIKTHNDKSYCVFATNFLYVNVIGDFKNRENAY